MVEGAVRGGSIARGDRPGGRPPCVDRRILGKEARPERARCRPILGAGSARPRHARGAGRAGGFARRDRRRARPIGGAVRHWLRRWDIRRAPGRRMPRADPLTAPPVVTRACSRHGQSPFRLEARGYYRCMRCRHERVSQSRRKMKRRLVEAAGGCCALCGYDRSPAALQFHHREPALKTFALSQQGMARGYAEALAETRKCALLCANCHAEVEIGYVELPRETAAGQDEDSPGWIRTTKA